MAERLLPSWLQPCSSCGCSFPGLYRPFTHNSLKSEDLYNWIHSSRRTGGKKLVRDRKKRGIRKERKKERKSCISQRHGRLSHSKSQQQFMMKEEKRDWGVEKHYERKQQKTYLLGSFQIRWVGWFCYSTTFGCSVGILAAAGVSVCTRWMDVPLWIHPFVGFFGQCCPYFTFVVFSSRSLHYCFFVVVPYTFANDGGGDPSPHTHLPQGKQ